MDMRVLKTLVDFSCCFSGVALFRALIDGWMDQCVGVCVLCE